MSIAENLAQIRERISRAAARVGRDPNSITLMAVSKTMEPERIKEAYAAGLRVFGENRVQEFEGKSAALRELKDAEWHLIGHLQSNKAKKAVELFHAIDSVDSLRLAEKLNQAAAEANKKLEVLIEIKVGQEESKAGIPLDSPELENLLRAAPQLENLQIRGLMTVPLSLKILKARGRIFVCCATCATKSQRASCRPFRWTCSPWACRTILKSPLKKDRPACVWAQLYSAKGPTRMICLDSANRGRRYVRRKGPSSRAQERHHRSSG